MSYFTELECSYCNELYDKNKLHNLCVKCNKPLLARYDLASAGVAVDRDELQARERTLWRYRELLPVAKDENIISLGEGCTSLIHAHRLGEALGHDSLFIKDESTNPTGSFKDRGLCMAVSRAKELGAGALAIPSAGNAGGAMSAYAAVAELPAFVYMPEDTPEAFIMECKMHGAHVELIDGLITDAGKIIAELKEKEGWFDVSTLKEPYRVEGKKTLGYEIAEQLSWQLPDVIIYPTGGGTGLIGMWKAFNEMEQMGWIGPERPRMVAVQAANCAPIVRAFNEKQEFATLWEDATTLASGLRVPAAVGDFLILRVIRESQGTALSISDDKMIDGIREVGRHEGLFMAPEGGAVVAALKILLQQGKVNKNERVVLCNTGSGHKYSENIKPYL